MHIAVCDDNVADRKQLERLLGRESDARKEKTGVFYIDSYGQGDKLFSSRMSYDLFFIDVVSGDETGFFLANRLYKGGVTAPIVLCSSQIDYKEEALKLEELPKNILFLSKPILKAQLSAVLDEAIVVEESKDPTIELRDKEDTYYVLEDDIVYARETDNYVNVFIKDGRQASMFTDILTFYDNISMYTHFAVINSKTMINVAHVVKQSPFKVRLTGRVELKVSPAGYLSLNRALKRLKEESAPDE